MRMDKSVPWVTVWHLSAEPRNAKIMTLGIYLSIRTSHLCQILILCPDRGEQSYKVHLLGNGMMSCEYRQMFSALHTR